MGERPIIMSAESVRAILDGRKTQTRRVIAPQPWEGHGTPLVGVYAPTIVDRHGEEGPGPDTFGAFTEDGEWAVRCPYGQPGDRLWVREAWHACPHCCDHEDGCFYGPRLGRYRADWGDQLARKCEAHSRWRSPLHMPRWASRLTLEITEVRVQRVQEITRGDAMEEGCPFANLAAGPDPRDWYREVWDALNARRGHPWVSNPWVWALTFTVVPAPGAEKGEG